ncbi:UDP-N-acetylglucosamine 2-epimerase (hydrolyzing) [Candidatus Woesearchaeota archaeon]|nr:UDP-N-acetylglucosamine 2-epimerase (hydrolyzing) [Candidatus Woesearchaeota archaeon]
MRKICVLTGTRAEYGLLKPIIRAIRNNPELELILIVSGMHLSRKFGETINIIKEDNFDINYTFEMNPKDDSNDAMAMAIGIGIQKIVDCFKNSNPDILLILGDRIEVLAGVIAAAYMNIVIAHIHGGDITRAGLDESARHAITKFAHIHFPATQKSAERILKMGEDKWRVHVVGAPALDTILNTPLLEKKALEKELNLKLKKPFILMIQHSVSTQHKDAEKQIKETLETVKELKYQTLIIYPNSDTGGRKIINQIELYAKEFQFIKIYKNLPYTVYLSLMKYADVMVGNSSSGIIESSSFKLPVVNIGIRQEGRERSNNIINVEHNKEKIILAIKKALSITFRNSLRDCKNPYGNGKTAQEVVNVLSSIKINSKLLQKKITY